MKYDILVDMDGVLADFDKSVMGVLGPVERRNFYIADDYVREHGEDAAQESWAVCNRPGFFQDLDPIEGAIDGMRALLSHPKVGNVAICTKPLVRNPTCKEDKVYWLRVHLPFFRGDVHLVGDKTRVNGSYLIDDKPNIPQGNWRQVIFDHTYNHSSLLQDKNRIRMMGWSDLSWLI